MAETFSTPSSNHLIETSPVKRGVLDPGGLAHPGNAAHFAAPEALGVAGSLLRHGAALAALTRVLAAMSGFTAMRVSSDIAFLPICGVFRKGRDWERTRRMRQAGQKPARSLNGDSDPGAAAGDGADAGADARTGSGGAAVPDDNTRGAAGHGGSSGAAAARDARSEFLGRRGDNTAPARARPRRPAPRPQRTAERPRPWSEKARPRPEAAAATRSASFFAWRPLGK